MCRTDLANLSWSIGPSNSHLIRIFLYITEGSIGGIIFYTIVTPFTYSVFSIFLNTFSFASFIIMNVLLLAVIVIAQDIVVLRRYQPQSRLLREWFEAHKLPWAIATYVFIVGILFWSQIVLNNEQIVSRIVFLLGGILLSLSWFLTVRGRIAIDKMVLIYNEEEVNMEMIADAERLTIGPITIIGLILVQSSSMDRSSRGIYLVPTKIIDQVWHVIDINSPQREKLQEIHFLQRRDFVVAFSILASALFISSILYWVHVPIVIVILVFLTVTVVGVVILLVSMHII